MFNPLFFIALTIFLLGLGYKFATWFFRNISDEPVGINFLNRLQAAAGGTIRTLFSSKIVELLKALLLDVLFQLRVYQEDRLRWLAHMLVFYGFMLLLLMHALQSIVTANLFSDYYPTLNPFYFLRDLFGVMVLVGVALMVARRYISTPRRLRTNSRDHIAIALVAGILLSGFVLEGLKITSYGEFERMVEDYAGLDDEDEIAALKALWIREYGLVAAHEPEELEEADMEVGREVHELNCADCHAHAGTAFASYGVAKLISPLAIWLDQAGAVSFLWHFHFILCFAALAYLPFSKMFHLVATPISLIINRVMNVENTDPANLMTRQIIELDACTHCGSCSLNCSAAMMYEARGNEQILPSEKMTTLRDMASGKKLDGDQLRSLQEGVYICTNCDRCTVRCPSGIRLKEIWYSVREQLVKDTSPPAMLSPFSFARGLITRERIAFEAYSKPIERAFDLAGVEKTDTTGSDEPVLLSPRQGQPAAQEPEITSFRHCFSCQTCTTVCPVVGNYADAEKTLGLLPHQIMCSLGLGLNDIAAKARMIWDCLTCYQCQESCPQQVDICDILYALKNRAVQADGKSK